MSKIRWVIVIGHPPCSSGTFISSLLASKFKKPWLIDEFSRFKARPHKTNSFISNDPEYKAYLKNYIDEKKWNEIFQSRIYSLIDFWYQSDSDGLILRDHTFSEFFYNKSYESPYLFKILKEKVSQNDVNLEFIYTNRDPFETFLSFSNSFYLASKEQGLNGFMKSYWNSLINWQKEGAKLLRVEDLKESKINKKITLENVNSIKSLKFWREDNYSFIQYGSGASGRIKKSYFYKDLRKRPYTKKIRNNIMNDFYYNKLCVHLGYPVYKPKVSFINDKISIFYSFIYRYRLIRSIVKRFSLLIASI